MLGARDGLHGAQDAFVFGAEHDNAGGGYVEPRLSKRFLAFLEAPPAVLVFVYHLALVPVFSFLRQLIHQNILALDFSEKRDILDEMNSVVHQNSSMGYNISDSGNVIGSYNTELNNYNISALDETQQILEWLSPLASRERHKAVRDARVDGVGDWLLRTEIFSAWYASEDRAVKPVLFCYGDPGVGKTNFRYEPLWPPWSEMLRDPYSSLVIDTLCREIDGDSVTVAYVYCDFSARNVQSAGTVLGSVLRQVVGSLPEIPDEVRKAFGRAKRQADGCGLRISEILEMLVKSLPSLKQAFICIDALDEFPSKHRSELLESLQHLVQNCPNVRLFLTGRPHIRDQVRKYFLRAAEMLPVSPSLHDIELYLNMRLGRDPEFDAMDWGLLADILRVIPEKGSGMCALSQDVEF